MLATTPANRVHGAAGVVVPIRPTWPHPVLTVVAALARLARLRPRRVRPPHVGG